MERSGSSGNGTGSGTGNGSRSTGSGTGNGPGSGRAAPPGGAGRALLLCLALLLPPALARPSPVLARPSPVRTLPSPVLARPSPVLALPSQPCHCLSRSRELLEAANASVQLLKELDTLGFECTLEEVDVEDITENQMNTIRACTAQEPGPGNCPTLERSTFDKGKCLQGISEDVRAYRAQLGNLEDSQLLGALDRMLEALGSCAGKVPEAPLGSGSSSGLGSAPFPERLRLCAVLQALRIRSVTISRMLNFLSSL
ncbi:interleukin-12 subunit alpha [Cinclus cinclus]|uniref:interleukin-12 subunit alpha n=1 Tax=Cinclus cinclus TaxID=127875 RepID=UPI002E0F948B